MQVGRGVVAAVAAALAVLALAVAFLLGRESVRSQAPPSPAPAVAAVPVVARPSAPAPVTPDAPGAPATASASPDAAAVRAYFAAVARIQAQGVGGDPSDLASALVASAMAGDPSGIDGLLASARAGAGQARKLQPPPVCAAYHQKLLSALDDSAALLAGLRSGLERQDTDALAGLATKASALQARLDGLSAEERDIRRRVGLAP
jgi:hypothetical protein